jgi:hypothetical protein
MTATFPELENPVTVPPNETFYVEAALDLAKGCDAVRHAVRDGFLRPFDIASAEIGDVRPLWVPFWRMAVSIDGLYVKLSDAFPLPTGVARHKEMVLMICARTSFPYEPKLPSLFGRVSGPAPLRVERNEMVAAPELEMLTANDAEVVEADVDRARAISIAGEMMLRMMSPTHAIYTRYEPHIQSAEFCLYPLYYARYRYSGEARRQADEDLFVAVSGKTGEVVAAKYPSAARSAAAKLRRFLSFDYR